MVVSFRVSFTSSSLSVALGRRRASINQLINQLFGSFAFAPSLFHQYLT